MVLLSHCFTSCLLPFSCSFCCFHLVLSCFMFCWDLDPLLVLAPHENSVGFLGLPHLSFWDYGPLSGPFLCCLMLISTRPSHWAFFLFLSSLDPSRPLFFSLADDHLTVAGSSILPMGLCILFFAFHMHFFSSGLRAMAPLFLPLLSHFFLSLELIWAFLLLGFFLSKVGINTN